MMEAPNVAAASHRLMAALATAVPGSLGQMVRAIVGVDVQLAPDAHLAPAHESYRDQETEGVIKPPARAIGWASNLLALCCQAYGQPVERAVPVGACLELLGIASVALDAAQDAHHGLLSAYAGEPYSDSVASQAGTGAGTLAYPETGGMESEALVGLAKNWDRRAALVSNASVALIGLFWQALLEHGPRYGVEPTTLLDIGRLIADRLVRMCHAQHLDLSSGCEPLPSLEEYDRMIEGKTGEIDGLACEAGAVLAGAAAQRTLWHTLGLERAVAQQLYDDYVDLAEDLTGGGQVTHPVLYGLSVADHTQRETILKLLEVARSGQQDATQAVQELSAVLRELGAEYYTLTCMVVRRKRALAALEALSLPPDVHDQLHRWVMSADPLNLHIPARQFT